MAREKCDPWLVLGCSVLPIIMLGHALESVSEWAMPLAWCAAGIVAIWWVRRYRK